MSKFDYGDPGTDPDYCNQYGGHPGIPRTCADCGRVVYVSRDDEYQISVLCQRCDRERPGIAHQQRAPR